MFKVVVLYYVSAITVPLDMALSEVISNVL